MTLKIDNYPAFVYVKDKEIRMDKPRIVNLPQFLDARGNLSFVEQENHIRQQNQLNYMLIG